MIDCELCQGLSVKHKAPFLEQKKQTAYRFYLSRLCHIVHCTEKIVTECMCADSVSAERVVQGEVGGVTHVVLCTWQLLGLKGSWMALDGPILTLAA